MNKAYLLIGGNEGDRMFQLEHAKEHINKSCGQVSKQSSIYETAPWGKTDQPTFLNQVLLIDTLLEPLALMAKTLEVEQAAGRKRREKYGPRIIDIDILFFNSEILDLPNLQIPHPELQNRRFALVPMHEIAPLWIHPLLHKTIGLLLEECPDTLDVKKI